MKYPKCQDCNKVMHNSDTCTHQYTTIDGKNYKRNTTYHDIGEHCHDCGILNGGIHHYGCDMERCPKCADEQQLISCECNKEFVKAI